MFKTEVFNRLWSSQNHRRDTLIYVSRFVSFCDFGVVTLDKIMLEILWDFREHLAETGIAISTNNRHMFALSSVFSNAVEASIIYNKLAFPK